MNKLTAKQKAFVAEYLIDLNATQAAIRAGYSEKTARSQGQRMLTNVDIARAVATGQARRSERTEVTQDYVLTAIKDTIEQYRGGGEGSNPNAVLKGAELLGRHLAMFTDKAVVDVNHGVREPAEIIARAKQAAERLGIELPLHLLGALKDEKTK